MLQQQESEDFVIATGESYTLRYFVELVFGHFNLDYNDYLESSAKFIRPSELLIRAIDESG